MSFIEQITGNGFTKMDETKLVKWPVQRSQMKQSFYKAWPQWKKKNTWINSDTEELYNQCQISVKQVFQSPTIPKTL